MGRMRIRAGKWVSEYSRSGEELPLTDLERRHLRIVLLILALALMATALAIVPDGWLRAVWAVIRAYTFPWGILLVGLGVGVAVCK